MLNEWRGKDSLGLTKRAQYEGKLVEWLSRPVDDVLEESVQSDPLVRKLMFQKFESKYKDHLSEEQKKILEAAVLDDDENFTKTVQTIKERTLKTIRTFKSTCDNSILLEKIDGVRERIQKLEETKSDNTVAKTLHLVHLLEEMETKNEQ